MSTKKWRQQEIAELVTILVGSIGLITAIAAAIRALSSEPSNALPYLVAAVPLCGAALGWVLWAKIRPLTQIGRCLQRFVAGTAEIQREFTEGSIRQSFVDGDPDADVKLYYLIDKLITSLDYEFQTNPQITSLLLGGRTAMQRAQYQYRLRKSIAKFLVMVNYLCRDLTEDQLMQKWKSTEEERSKALFDAIRKTLDNLESAFQLLTDAQTVTTVFKYIDRDNQTIFRCMYSNFAAAERRNAERTLPKDGTIAGHVLKNGAVVFGSFEDERIRGKFEPGTYPDRYRFFQSAVVVPVAVNGRNVGVLAVDSKVRDLFPDDAVHLVQVAADIIAIFLQITEFLDGVVPQGIETSESISQAR